MNIRNLSAIMLTAVCAFTAGAQNKPKYPHPVLAPHEQIFGYAYDNDKTLVIGFIYEEAGQFDQNMGQAIVKFHGAYGVIDPKGTWAIEPNYDFINLNADHGTYTVKKSGKYGILGRDGKVIHTLKFDNIGETDADWYEGELNGEWVYVGPDGRITSDMSQYMKWKDELRKAREKRRSPGDN